LAAATMARMVKSARRTVAVMRTPNLRDGNELRRLKYCKMLFFWTRAFIVGEMKEV
jgi:hypothetical protein